MWFYLIVMKLMNYIGGFCKKGQLKRRLFIVFVIVHLFIIIGHWVVLIRRRVGVSSFLLSQKCSNRTGQIIHSNLCMGKYSKNMGLQYACPSIQQSVSRFFNLCECSSHRQANICIHVRISSVNSEWDNVQLNKSTRSSKCYIWYDRSLSQTSELLFHCRIFYVNTPSS